MTLDGLEGVVRTARLVAAGTSREWREDPLVRADEGEGEHAHRSQDDTAGASVPAWESRLSTSVTRS